MENKIKTKIKTSEERLEQCGWELAYHGVLSSCFDTKIGDIKVSVGIDNKTYELYYLEIDSNEDEHCAVLYFSEIPMLMEKIKELEVEPEEN